MSSSSQFTLANTTATVNAALASTAWLNAFLAHSEEESRTVLFRTLSVEFFSTGVLFIGCDGTILLRTWVASEGEDEPAKMPEVEESPEKSVVVMDADKFASAFMRTLGAASAGDENAFTTLTLSVEPSTMQLASEAHGEPLGEAFASEMLTLSALGQKLHCRLYESDYPDWRALQFGLEAAERVDGMKLATRMFATVGKLKGVTSVDCAFAGGTKQIQLTGSGAGVEVRGLMMPMRRVDDDA